MDFFEQQEASRRTSRWLVLWYLVAAALTVASYAAVGLIVSWRVAGLIAALVAGCILAVSAYRMWQFRGGGHAVADLLGAALLDPERCAGNERRLLNVVEEPVAARYRRVAELADDARAMLSLVALASGKGEHQAFARGAAVLELGWSAPLSSEALTSGTISAAFERLRHLAPLAKPALLRACVEAAMVDGSLRLAEAELLRAVAATLDCPVPPVLAAQDPLTLAA